MIRGDKLSTDLYPNNPLYPPDLTLNLYLSSFKNKLDHDRKLEFGLCLFPHSPQQGEKSSNMPLV